MTDILFYIFAALTLVPALMVVLSRNPVNSAMFMIVAFIGVACMFLLLEAYFLAILQVLVYAGAVMVLFLFIIMLLDVEQVRATKPSIWAVLGGTLGLMMLLTAVLYLFLPSDHLPSPELSAAPALAHESTPFAFATSAKAFGYLLFTKYMLPFQVAGFLLLVAMVGVIVLSKRSSLEVTQSK